MVSIVLVVTIEIIVLIVIVVNGSNNKRPVALAAAGPVVCLEPELKPKISES